MHIFQIMAKVRDINDESEPTQSCCEKVAAAAKNCCETLAGWELWKKILLGFGIVSALTLVITLPIVLTGNETSVNPDGNMTTVAGSTGLFTTTLAADSTTRESTTTANASKTTMATTRITSAATTTKPKTTTTKETTTASTTTTSTANSLSTTSSMTTGSLTTTTVMTTSITTTAGATSVITTTVAATTTAITTSGFQTTTVQTVPTVVPQPPPYIGWGEWLEWSGCTVSCGLGQRSRLRLCSDGNGGFGDENDCPGDGFNSEECSNGKCLSGDKMVTGGHSRIKIQI